MRPKGPSGRSLASQFEKPKYIQPSFILFALALRMILKRKEKRPHPRTHIYSHVNNIFFSLLHRQIDHLQSNINSLLFTVTARKLRFPLRHLIIDFRRH